MSLNKYTQLSYEERVIIENRLKNNESIVNSPALSGETVSKLK